MITIDLPWPPKELNPNARIDRRSVAPIKKKHRADCYLMAKVATKDKIAGRHHIMLTFFPPNDWRQRDLDNLLASMKAGLDGVADALGINDREFDPVTISMADTNGPLVRLTLVPHQETA